MKHLNRLQAAGSTGDFWGLLPRNKNHKPSQAINEIQLLVLNDSTLCKIFERAADS